ncbi:sigma-54-dependent transcriptional regulator variant [Halalkalibacter wakoensis JCM 9140]|uniref:Sigma-54-dependent transcriptional regulator variant n=1 Tax=Halalkalibacter wakoensis JCM 9140 TaxID=1236970 RepID=W4PYZ7_9BACI|nr:sigma-54-dependent Fis family transcriptional regulator [Halalkalibacter wakoensis]GAE24937.1 sigma-54-dependent transcriptional regulator variant [Halalkalibacter wakoensis JCM 9140]
MFLKPFETKQMLEAILGSIDEAIHVVNAEGITIYYNDVAAKNDGTTIEDVLGKHVLDVFPSLNKESSTLLKVIKSGNPIIQQSQTYKNIKGQLIDTVNTTLPIKVGEQLIGAVEIAKDLTTVRNLSQSLMDLQAKVHHQKSKPVAIHGTKYGLDDIVTNNDDMIKVKELARKAASTSSPVLIFGETGTGKELLIQAIHQASRRRDQPFIAQNCATLPSSLLESTLFGTKKGSFTGAVDRVGLFELAHTGTLFLDEINTMSLEFQTKLLRVVEDGIIRRIGGTNSYAVDVRMIVAMNEHPLTCIEKNQLRADLYYRFNVFFIEIPPLRNRLDDVPLLADHFVKKYNFLFGKLVLSIDPLVIKVLQTHNWPGNVRELEHAIEFAMNMVEGDVLLVEHLPVYLKAKKERQSYRGNSLKATLKEVEVSMIIHALQQCNYNVFHAAQLLDVPRQTLQYKIKKHQISLNR